MSNGHHLLADTAKLLWAHVTPLSVGSVCCPSAHRAALEHLFGRSIAGVRIVVRPANRWWWATTRRNTIIIYGNPDEFFAHPDVVLEEYFHVLEQWNAGRLTRWRYVLAFIREGYDNHFEREAKSWVDEHISAYRGELLAATHHLGA